jgi:hypothetical protein
VDVIGHQRPGEDLIGAALKSRRDAVKEIPIVGGVSENGLTVQPPGHHVMQEPGRVQAGLGERYIFAMGIVKIVN